MGLEAHARVKRGTQVAREEGGSEDTTGQFIIIARAFMTTSNSKSGINGCAPDTKYTVSILAPHICESWGLITGKCAFGHCRKNKKTKMHIQGCVNTGSLLIRQLRYACMDLGAHDCDARR